MYSQSQIGLYKRCVRLWYLKYVMHVKQPYKPVFELGKRCHTIAENWLKTGVKPDTNEKWTDPNNKKVFYPGRIMNAGLGFLPAPGVCGDNIERRFEVTYKGLKFFGFIDFEFIDDKGKRHVGDHKTTGTLKWAMSKKALLADIQTKLYAYAGIENDEGIWLDWVYYQKNGLPQAKKVSIYKTREAVMTDMEEIYAIAREIENFKADPAGFLRNLPSI